MNYAQRSFMNSFGCSEYTAIASIAGCFIYPGVLYLFVFKFNLDVIGLGLATLVTQLIVFAVLLYFSHKHP